MANSIIECGNTLNMTPSVALLLRGSVPSPNDHRLAEVLDFFGISWAPVILGEMKEDDIASLTAGHSMFSILISAPCLAETLQSSKSSTLPAWLTAAASVFVYGFQSTDVCTSLLRNLTGDRGATVGSVGDRRTTASITEDLPEICGPMSGLELELETSAAGLVLKVGRASGVESIVDAPEGCLFARFVRDGVAFFCDPSPTIVDIHERSPTYFDVRKSFAGAVPLVMYLKWSFRGVCWTAPEINACIIIDDPLLRRRYGYLDFQEILQLMGKHLFTMTIAFIPWNWRRTERETVELFHQNRGRLSVCVHGCDHTGGEFATQSAGVLDRKLKTAKSRMTSLFERSGLLHDPVMVFPQGAFSPEAAIALKKSDFVAAVNTEVAPANGVPNETTIADVWSVAILRYGFFSIFTRRYISHGIENFAFDGLLGKPCFIVGHHELLRDGGVTLMKFLGRLNSLNWKLSWRTLGEALRRSYAVQRRNGAIRAKMFGEQLIIENREMAAIQFVVSKEEVDFAAVRCVTVNQKIVDFQNMNGSLEFKASIPPTGAAEIRCAYHVSTEPPAPIESTLYKLKVAIRRCLSEIRDNYFS